jgi:hypothetical protein
VRPVREVSHGVRGCKIKTCRNGADEACQRAYQSLEPKRRSESFADAVVRRSSKTAPPIYRGVLFQPIMRLPGKSICWKVQIMSPYPMSQAQRCLTAWREYRESQSGHQTALQCIQVLRTGKVVPELCPHSVADSSSGEQAYDSSRSCIM